MYSLLFLNNLYRFAQVGNHRDIEHIHHPRKILVLLFGEILVYSPLPSGNHWCDFCISSFAFSRMLYKQIIWYLAFSVWLTALSLMPLRLIYVVAGIRNLFFSNCWIGFNCVLYYNFFIYPPILGVVELFPIFRNYEESWYKLPCTVLWVYPYFYFSWVNT